MMDLSKRKIAILATDGYEQSELTEPRNRLRHAGAIVDVVSVKSGSIRGWKVRDWGDSVPVNKMVEDARVSDYDALVLPGGQINPDILRTNERAVKLVRAFVDSGKPVAAICHGPWMLVEADALRGRRVTSYHSIRTDVRNAGGDWVDEPVVVDGNLITSRRPDDLPAFIDKLTEAVVQRAEIASAGA